MEYIIIMAIGALASILANKGIAVFNDGFRPVVPQYFEGKISRKELAATSFAISFGLVVGFGIPTSIAASIILIHSILLATDIIGTIFKDDVTGLILSGVVGAIYGAAILGGLQFVVDLFAAMPFNFLTALGSVSAPVTVAFAVFPAVAIAMQHGFKKGMITGMITVLVWFVVKKFGIFTLGGAKVALNAEGISMLVGTILMVVFATQNKQDTSTSNQDLTNVFSGQVARIQKNWWILGIMGGLIAAGTSLLIIAGDPTSLALMSEGQMTSAAMAAFARAIGFVPLVFTTGIVTGVYGPAGATFVFVVGIALHGNPLLAFVVGAAVMVLEVFLINIFAKAMDKFPGVREMGEHIRTAMSRVLEVALLVGGVIAADKMASGIGSLFVIGFYLLNKQSKKPIVDLAVGPVAAIIFGILLNILLLIGLWALPVVA
ncbi:YhfT family protein [Erysipelothrix aquatica]|uniref:YhfT family protein n=1 Tax=Erysipelothrix aquatica TaxID=2683714 RepID=UPI0013589709|nr:YhfT family protein [Erysipelothrix aquatica]